MGIYCEDCDILLDTEVIPIDADNHTGDTYRKVIVEATEDDEVLMGIYCQDCDALLGTEIITPPIETLSFMLHRWYSKTSAWYGTF